MDENIAMNVRVRGVKTQLSKLLDLVQDSETVVIERHGRPVAQLVAVRQRRASTLGAMRGEFSMTAGWERPLSDEEAETFWVRNCLTAGMWTSLRTTD